MKPTQRSLLLVILASIVFKSCVQQAPGQPVAMFNGFALMGISKESLKSIAVSTMQEIVSQITDPGVQKDLKELSADASNWHYPLEPHVTTKFWGSVMPTDPQEITEYNAFKEGVITTVKFPVVCYAVGGLLALPGFLDQTQTQFSNAFAHTTVVTGSLPAQASNDLIEALYAQVPEFAANYDKGFAGVEKRVYRYSVTLKDQSFVSYVVLLPRLLTTTGSTRRFYIA